jgi:6-phosphogluconolactonase
MRVKAYTRGLPMLPALASLAAVAAATRVSGATSPSPVIGHVYVNNNNTNGVNTIGAFDRHADGTLTPMPGSPFVAGGLGSPATTLSQGALQLSSDSCYLLAVDRGSNQISVLRIEPDGSLDPVADEPVCSNGVNPVSIAIYGDLVYVANAGTPTSSGQTNYTGFILDPGGHLRPLPGSTVTLPDGTRLTDVLFSPDGNKLVGTRVSTSLIDSFTVGADGLLTAAPDSPFAAQGVGPFGSEFHPINPEQLYVSNALGGKEAGSVSAFIDGADGTLASIDASPFSNWQTAPCWIEISHDGRYLFVVNTDSKSISSYSIASDGSLALRDTTPVNPPTALPADARLAPDGSTLWIVDSGGNTVSGFAVDGGTVTELPDSPTPGPAGAQPIGIVVT